MNHALLVAALLGAFVGAGCAGSQDAAAPVSSGPLRLRVVTYNMHHGAGADGRVDLPRIAAVITSLKPDLVALQEVDAQTARSSGVDQAAQLGKLTGMHVEYARAMDFQGGQYGQAILSRWPIASLTVEPLPGTFDAEPRIVAMASIAATKEHPTILFASTHLDHLQETSRVPQARLIANKLGQDMGRLVILAGDFNAGPGSATMNVFATGWTSATAEDALSYPASTPAKKIDWILTPKTQVWTVIEARVVENAIASDHRPVLAEFERAR